MENQNFLSEINKRRTFAIISHPDAGKSTITEKILLLGGAIQTAGTVKSRGSNQYVKSDWVEIEKQRGISITTSAMQFYYKDCIINLLDTPGHEDFSEDTYRTLTAVDSCLMVIDGGKGVEQRTLKLMEVARLRNTPVLTFINKLDRDIHDTLALLDEIEIKLKITCVPITWPIGCGKLFKGIYNLYHDKTYLYQSGHGHHIQKVHSISGLNNPELENKISKELINQLHEELNLIKSAIPNFNQQNFLNGKITPVFFGSALGNFGVDHMLDTLVKYAPAPTAYKSTTRIVSASEKKFSGFIFKIQANMDPKHRDRIAFMRIVSGCYHGGMKMYQVRTKKEITVSNALVFMARDRNHIEKAWAGDIIGLHNHGTIQIADTFTQGEDLKYTGIPNFAPELFRRIRLDDPLKQKQLLKGLIQLSEEGAVQVFRPLLHNNLIVGALGGLQFDVVVSRLKEEYHVNAVYENVNVVTARWIDSQNTEQLKLFKQKNESHLALDNSGNLVYIAPTTANLTLTKERYPEIVFHQTFER